MRTMLARDGYREPPRDRVTEPCNPFPPRHCPLEDAETCTTDELRASTIRSIAILPKLRVQALALTRNRAAAEDLVQDAVCNALSAQDSFIPGTNFAAWMHRILRNRFISNLRKRRDTTDIDDVPCLGLRHAMRRTRIGWR